MLISLPLPLLLVDTGVVFPWIQAIVDCNQFLEPYLTAEKTKAAAAAQAKREQLKKEQLEKKQLKKQQLKLKKKKKTAAAAAASSAAHVRAVWGAVSKHSKLIDSFSFE